jgi:putative spermidine/putrescine transport system ATP-binding protein
MSTVTLEAVSKHYGDAVAVARVDLDVRQGELVVLLGPSGCGKTTTLRMIAGFIEATSGTIRIGERDVTNDPPYRRNVGLVFQNYALFPHLTVFENVAFGLRRRKVPEADIGRRVAAGLDMVQLGALAQRLPRQMSGGQQQRVALARALVIEPDVLLLDEPLSNLDAKLRQDVRVEIRRLQQSLGLTTIMVTHDQEEAMTMGDRLVVMSGGMVQQTGSPRELYQRPANRFVAGFVGRSNFLGGRTEGSSFVTNAGWRLRADHDLDAAGTLMLRPEAIHVGQGGPNDAQGAVEAVTYLGAATELSVRLDGGDLVLVHENIDAGRQPGDRIAITVPPAALVGLND